jgi:hypothetical protein
VQKSIVDMSAQYAQEGCNQGTAMPKQVSMSNGHGLIFYTGGAHGCSFTYQFVLGSTQYELLHARDMGEKPYSEIDGEMKKIIESIREK